MKCKNVTQPSPEPSKPTPTQAQVSYSGKFYFTKSQLVAEITRHCVSEKAPVL